MKRRSPLVFRLVPVLFLAVVPLLVSCGKNYYFGGRNLPPSKVLNRVLIAEQNASALVQGALPFVDAYYDIRHPYNSSATNFSISGYSGKLPLTIQNMAEEQTGYVFGTGDNSFTAINYSREASGNAIAISAGLAASVFIDRPRKYVYAANEQSHVLSVADLAANHTYILNLPNVYRVSVNPGGTLALAFVQNSSQAAGTSSCVVANPSNNPANNPSGVPPVACPVPNEADFAVYSIVHLDSAQQTAAANNPNYLGAQDCEPQNLPQYCVFPVSTGANATFDRPIKAVFSPDGSSIYVLNCGPECGGTTASVSVIPVTGNALNKNSIGASGIALEAQSNIAIHGGVTNGIFNGNTLYVAGQCFANTDLTCATSGSGDGLFVGQLSIVNTQSGAVAGPFAISDGTHNKMVFADDSTLWIGSKQCQFGEHYKQNQAGSGTAYGCLTMFNTSNNSVFIDAYKGDATGIAAVTGLHKVYTAEGGQVHIYNTTDGSERDNSNVTVSGTAIDVAYMDATSDANNTNY
ncbi:MAG: hypothetical protein JOZ83_07940 [Silvibacterium sp.]|nr:hypothetical protein [Silvibacterium sp.]